jgi:MFS family permease
LTDVSRFFSGFGASQFISTVPMMMSEMAPPRHRGFVVGMFGLGISIGYCATSWIGVGFYFVPASGAQWRIPYAITTVPSITILCLLPWIPESPRWLLMHNRAEDAAKVIRSLHGSQQDAEVDRFVSLEFDQMKEQLTFELQNQVTWVEFLTSRRYARRTWTAALTMMASQVSTPSTSAGFWTNAE